MTTERIDVELRSASVNGNTLTGTAHVFGERAALQGKVQEKFAPGAFNRTLADPATDVRAFWQHDQRLLLGRQSSGTLQIEADDEGLPFRIDLPDTTYANDLKVLVARGDLRDMSFGFIPGRFTRSTGPDGVQVRTHTDVAALVDISPVSLPAYSGTSVSLRSTQDESARVQAVRIRHRVTRSTDRKESNERN